MRKTHKQKKISPHHERHAHMRRGLVFGLCFGALMTAVGLAQLLAAPFIGISLSPSTQSAGPNQVKIISVQLNSGSQDVNGGSVQVNFDSGRLSFTSLSKGSNDFRIIQQQVTANSVIFEYESTDSGGTDGFFNLANIRFTTKSVPGTHTTNLTGSAVAYEGRSSPDYYPVSNLSASITITGPAAPAPSPPSPSPAPPSPAPSSPSPPSSPASPPAPSSPGSGATSSPGSLASPGQPSPAAPGSPSSAENTNSSQDDSNSEDSSASEGEPTLEDFLSGMSSEDQAQNESASIPPAAILGALILIADGISFLYYRKHKARSRLHFDEPIAGADPDLEPIEPFTSPPTESQAPVQPVVSSSPPPAVKTATSPPPPVVESPAKPHHAAQPISGLAIKQTWGEIRKEQAERIAHGDKNLEEKNTPDMFELANAHPESYGSQSLYEEESGGKPEPNKKSKS